MTDLDQPDRDAWQPPVLQSLADDLFAVLNTSGPFFDGGELGTSGEAT